MASGDSLRGWKRGLPAWDKVADLAALGLKRVTRIAISPTGERIAFVAEK